MGGWYFIFPTPCLDAVRVALQAMLHQREVSLDPMESPSRRFGYIFTLPCRRIALSTSFLVLAWFCNANSMDARHEDSYVHDSAESWRTVTHVTTTQDSECKVGEHKL